MVSAVVTSRKNKRKKRAPLLFLLAIPVAVLGLFLCTGKDNSADKKEENSHSPAIFNVEQAEQVGFIENTCFEETNGVELTSGSAIQPHAYVTSSKIIRPHNSGKKAEPIKRRQRGTAEIIEAAKARGEKVTPDFEHPSENFFSLYARPGQPVAPPPLPDNFEEDALKALDEDIVIYDEDSAEVEELKCIVAGIKEELRAYLKNGGTVLDFVTGLKMRQAEEEQIFTAARGKILLLYKEGDFEKTYSQWLEVNKELAKQGILPVQLPRGMRKYLPELEQKYGKGENSEN